MSITYKIEIDNEKIANFYDLVEKVFSALMESGREMIRKHMEKLDCELLEQRDKKRYRTKGIRKTSVKTKLGTVEYERRMYLDRQTNTHVFLLDEAMNSRCVGLFDEGLCKTIEEMICEQSYRETARSVSELTGQYVSHQAVWDIVQQAGKKAISLSTKPAAAAGLVESKILYEEADGDWLKLQGDDREKYGVSKEMKIGIAYDGVLYKKQKNGKIRRKLDNKVAYASFEAVGEFRKHCENTISRVYNTDEIELRVRNGDGASWIQKSSDCDCICVLDKFHRNKKITECVKNKKIAESLRELLFQGRYDELLDCIEAYANSSEDAEAEKLRELYSYYSENREALAGYYDRGRIIPPTREPGVIHHARLGSMEGNVFTLIGNRMKGRRACWSIDGGNNLAALLCRHYTEVDYEPMIAAGQTGDISSPVLSAASIKEISGKGYEFSGNVSLPSTSKWLRNLSHLLPLSQLSF